MKKQNEIRRVSWKHTTDLEMLDEEIVAEVREWDDGLISDKELLESLKALKAEIKAKTLSFEVWKAQV